MAFDYYHLDPNLPPEIAIEAENLQRRQRIAEVLTQQALQPRQGTQAGRFYVAPGWGQGLGQLGQALLAGHMQGQTERDFRELGTKAQQISDVAVEKYMNPPQGASVSPSVPMTPPVIPPASPQPQPTGSVTPGALPAEPIAIAPSATPETTPTALGTVRDQNMARIKAGLLSRDPRVRHLAAMELQAETARQQHEADQAARSHEAAIASQRQQAFVESEKRAAERFHTSEREAADKARIAEREAADKARVAEREAADKRHADLMRELQKSSLGAHPNVQIVTDEAGNITLVDKKTGIATPAITPTGEKLKGVPKPLTEAQANANIFATRAEKAHGLMNQLDKPIELGGKPLEERISTSGLATKRAAENIWGIGGVAGAVGNVLLTPEQQKIEQAQRDFVNAVLRKESGAAISESEFKNAIKQYFPQPGDSQAVIIQKRQNRQTEIEGLKAAAGSGLKKGTAGEAPSVPPKGPKTIASDADYNALPSGAVFIGPDGKMRKKP